MILVQLARDRRRTRRFQKRLDQVLLVLRQIVNDRVGRHSLGHYIGRAVYAVLEDVHQPLLDRQSLVGTKPDSAADDLLDRRLVPMRLEDVDLQHVEKTDTLLSGWSDAHHFVFRSSIVTWFVIHSYIAVALLLREITVIL